VNVEMHIDREIIIIIIIIIIIVDGCRVAYSS
jgi:hypothetical protein